MHVTAGWGVRKRLTESSRRYSLLAERKIMAFKKRTSVFVAAQRQRAHAVAVAAGADAQAAADEVEIHATCTVVLRKLVRAVEKEAKDAAEVAAWVDAACREVALGAFVGGHVRDVFAERVEFFRAFASNYISYACLTMVPAAEARMCAQERAVCRASLDEAISTVVAVDEVLDDLVSTLESDIPCEEALHDTIFTIEITHELAHEIITEFAAAETYELALTLPLSAGDREAEELLAMLEAAGDDMAEFERQRERDFAELRAAAEAAEAAKRVAAEREAEKRRQEVERLRQLEEFKVQKKAAAARREAEALARKRDEDGVARARQQRVAESKRLATEAKLAAAAARQAEASAARTAKVDKVAADLNNSVRGPGLQFGTPAAVATR